MRLTEKDLPLNILNYWCAPNAATPEYVPYTNFRSFVAWLLYDYTGGWTKSCTGHPGFFDFLMWVGIDIIRAMEMTIAKINEGEGEVEVDQYLNFGHYTPQNDEPTGIVRYWHAMYGEVAYEVQVQFRYSPDDHKPDEFDIMVDCGVVRDASPRTSWFKCGTEDGWLEKMEKELVEIKKEYATFWQRRAYWPIANWLDNKLPNEPYYQGDREAWVD